MAAAPTYPLVSVDEYLNTSYEYDMEYVDGVLVERAMPTPAHSYLQAILIDRLRQHRKTFGFAVLPECRVELVPRSRYRVPDVLLAGLPAPKGKFVSTVPWAIVEILSPDDRVSQQVLRLAEYWNLGVGQILVLDPEEFLAYRFVERSLSIGAIEGIPLPDGRVVPLSSDEIFAELKEELSRGR